MELLDPGQHPEPGLKPYHLAKFQPTAYIVGGFLGYTIGCKHALVFATGPSEELALLQKFFNVILLPPDVEEELHFDPEVLNDAVVISEISCSGGRDLPRQLTQLARSSCLSVIAEKHSSDSAAMAESCLSDSLSRAGLTPAFIGPVPVGQIGESKTIAIIDNELRAVSAVDQVVSGPPASFRVVAIMAVFNEGDIIVRSLEKLLAQGVEVYLIDNWSTDGSYEAVREKLGSKLAGLERFPTAGPAENFDLYSLLSRKEEIAKTLRADWFIHCDADEIRYSPWPGVSLRDALYRVERQGYNAINHTILEFHPVDNGFTPGADFEDYFQYFSFAAHTSNFLQIKTWKNMGPSFSLAANHGHQVSFEGRRIYPFKFLVKHYPIQSQEHGIRKVFCERRARYLPAAKAKGWHTHYDALPEDHSFLKDAATLIRFETDYFYSNYLVQRLTGIGSLI